MAVAALLLAVPAAGCLDSAFSQNAEMRPRTKVDLDEAFAPEDSFNPDTPGTARYERAFTVQATEEDLTVDLQVTFEHEDPSGTLPSGQVRVVLTEPDGDAHRWTFERTGSDDLAVADPAPGAWDLVVEAQGQGQVRVHVQTMAPAA